MSDWTAGYVADIGYTYGYYTELNPLRVRLAFLNAGLVPPKKLWDTHLLDDPPLHCHTQAMTRPRTELIALKQ